MNDDKQILQAADILVDLYAQEFGGKDKGRYRISEKLMRQLLKRRRLYEADITALSRAMFQRGYVFLDLDGFFVVLSANSFVNYRRVADANIQSALDQSMA